MDFGWEQLDYLPHSPDLASSGFLLFVHMKSFLGSQNFNEDDEMKEAVNTWLHSHAASFYDDGMQTSVPL